jgi:NAD(P)-dependent dehydrogenase (short-subunit alcohol dehydrogenase family)
VSGGTSGLGQACAQELSAHGARILLVGRNPATLESTRDTLSGNGHETAVLDLSQLDRMAPEMTRIARQIGPLYGFCHAAGIVHTQPLHSTTPGVVQELLTVNLLAGLELARTIARRDVMTPEGGSLVFLSSVYARVGVAGQTGYSASKGAVTAAVRSMAIELARRGIRVNAISPGLVKTPMTEAAFRGLSQEQITTIERQHPLGPGAPIDVARAALFLLAPTTTWITGIDLPVDGGYSAH